MVQKYKDEDALLWNKLSSKNSLESCSFNMKATAEDPGSKLVVPFVNNREDLFQAPTMASRSPGEGNGIPLQYSCLGYPMDRGAWQV